MSAGFRRLCHTGAVIVVAVVLLLPAEAWAGMPAPYTLTDVARMRVETISFFLLVLLGAAALIRLIWNGLSGQFPRLPRLTYAKAIGLIALWGLLYAVVLGMIAGTRELMTPGAWERRGATYRLTGGDIR